MGVFSIYLVVVLETIASSMIIPVLPSLNHSLHLSSAAIGAISSISSLIVLSCGFLHGIASDKHGKLALLKVSTLSQIVGYALLAVSVNWVTSPTNSLIAYILSRLIPSMFKCTMVVSQAFMVDSSESSADSISRISQLYALSNAAFVIGPSLGGYLSGFDMMLPINLGIIVCVLNYGVLCTTGDKRTFDLKSPKRPATPTRSSSSKSFFGRENSFSSKSNSSEASRIIELHEALVLKFLFQCGNMMYDSLYAQQLHDRLGLTPGGIGSLFSLSGAIAALVNGYIMPVVVSEFKTDEVLIIASIMQAAGLTIWGLSNTIWTAIIYTSIVATSSNIFLTICQSCIASSSSVERNGSGTTLSVSSTVDRAARSIAPLLGGTCVEMFGSSSLGYFSGSTALLCSAIIVSFSEPKTFHLYQSSSWIKEYGSVVFNRQESLLQE